MLLNQHDTFPKDSPDTLLLKQIVEVLQNSTIAEEKAKDPLSKFWAGYKKVSSEYDDEMVERCNGNMDIVLIFAGLFSAINTTFIVSMQPNPINTTNTLLVQLIQITAYGPTAIQPATLSSLTSYSSSDVWTQALAYLSLAFSLLAALGAVLGKQWLGYYKKNCYGCGSLSDRCQRRHRKFQKLRQWRLENVLQSFPVLLQISVLLFGLSLGAAMWTQQQTISILVIATTAFGALCHLFVIVASVTYPSCPFQTPISLAIRAVFDHFCATVVFQDHDEAPMACASTSPASSASASTASTSTACTQTVSASTTSASTMSAMQWILETSTKPDIVRSVIELLPTMPVPMEPVINVMSLCTRVRDMFKACFDQRCISILGDSALAYGTALFYFSANYRNARDMLYVTTRNWHIWERWRMLYLPRLLEECKISYRGMIKTSNATSKLMCQANARTALRMAVAGGIDEFAHPNDKRLVRDGQFRLQCPPLDIHLDLISCAEHFYAIDDVDVAGDSLLLLTGVLGESLSLDHRRITPFLNGGRGQTPRLRQIALRAACRVLSYRCDSPCDADFSQAVLNAIYPSIKDERATVRNVIHLLHLEKWREGSDLALCSLPEIQLLVLLVLRAPKVDDPEIYISYCRALIRYMGADKQFPFRYSALRIVYGARQDLAMITATGVDEELRNMVLSELSPALLAAISSADHQVYHDPSYSTHLFHYISLIATLAKSPDWYPILIRDGHVKKCIALIDHSQFQSFQSSNFYLAEIFYRIASPSHAASSCDISFTDKQWWELMKDACIAVQLCDDSYLPVDDIPILAAVVSNTRIPLDLSKGELQSFEVCLSKALDRLRGRNPRPGENVISAVADLKKMVNDRWEVTVG